MKWQEMIEIEGPYHFDMALNRMLMDPLHIVDMKNRSVKVPIYSEMFEVATVQAIGTVNQPKFIVSGKNAASKQIVLEKVYTIFQWHTSLSEIQAHFSKTTLKEIIEIHYGTPLITHFSLFSTLVQLIIHQQLNMKFAITLTEQFVRTFGFEVEGVPFYPSPQIIASLQTEQLRELKFSQRKAEYLIDLSKRIVNGELDLDQLALKSDEEIIQQLVQIRGIGPWTAENFLMFGLGRPNLFPFADIGIQNAIKQLFDLDRKPTKEEMIRYSEEWKPYLSYAALYLWRSIEFKQ